MAVAPGLFGITHSNRDFSLKDTWGKNQFNSSFPAALACYLYSKELKAVYYKTDSSMQTVLIILVLRISTKPTLWGTIHILLLKLNSRPFKNMSLALFLETIL